MPLNPVEEKEFEDLNKMCQRLKVPAPPSIHIGLQVRDKDGNLIFDDLQRGHSFVRNMFNAIFGMVTTCASVGTTYGAGSLAMRSKSNASLTGAGGLCGPYNKYTDYGPIVGTGDTAFNTQQYSLVAEITNGASAGQLSRIATTMAVPVYDNTPGSEKWTQTIVRVFNNNSGGSIEVKEIALENNPLYFGALTSGGLGIFERSVLSPTVTVPNGAQLTVSYAISMDFSAID